MGFFPHTITCIYNLTDILREIVNLHIQLFSVFNLKTKKRGPEKTPNSSTFQAVITSGLG